MPLRQSTLVILILLGVCVAGLASPPLLAQDLGVAVFENRTHRFEPIPEGTFAQHAFRFKNEGNAPIRITGVRASCGCTTPEWTTDPVGPGQSGSVIALYATLGRPGPFRRDITVDTDGEPARVVLFIEGDVVPPTVDLATASRQGNLAFDTGGFDFGPVEQGTVVSHTFLVSNTGSRPVRILDARAASNVIGVRFSGNAIFPGEVSRVDVTLYTAGQPAFPLDLSVDLVTDDSDRPEKQVTLQAAIVLPASGSD